MNRPYSGYTGRRNTGAPALPALFFPAAVLNHELLQIGRAHV